MKRVNKVLSYLVAVLMLFTFLPITKGIAVKAEGQSKDSKDIKINGNWEKEYDILYDTVEAGIMVRVGDIDNFGYGWGKNPNSPNHYYIDPFSGEETPVHSYPFTPKHKDPEGTDRIMVVSGYKKGSGAATDGYTSGTAKNYDNHLAPVTLTYNLKGKTVNNATIQMFVDDIQPSKWIYNGTKWVNKGRGGFSTSSYNQYKVTFCIAGKDPVEIPEFAEIVNSLDQHGPIGKLITFNVPEKYLNMLQNGEEGFEIKIDDPRKDVTNKDGKTIKNTGDGYAIDFVKLLINKTDGFTDYDGTIKGKVYEASYSGTNLVLDKSKPIGDVKLSISGVEQPLLSGPDGTYSCDTVPAGQVVINVEKDGYAKASYTIGTLEAGKEITYDIGLIKTNKPLKPSISLNNYAPTNENLTVTIEYPGVVQSKKYRIDGGQWRDYTAPFVIDKNCIIEAKSIKEIQTGTNTKETFESDVCKLEVTNIDKNIPPRPILTPDTTAIVNRDVIVTITYPQGQAVKEAAVRIGEGTWTYYNQSNIPNRVTVSSNAKVYAKYKNGYGNWSDVADLNVNNIDKEAPTAVLQYETVDGANYNPSNWTNKDVKAILSGFDSNATTVTIKNGNSSDLSVNTSGGNLTATYTFSVATGQVGTPTATFVLRDPAGNETEIDASAKIDKKAPIASVRLKVDGRDYIPTTWTNKDVVVEFYNFDDQAAVVSVEGVDSSRFTTTNTPSGKVVSYTISSPQNIQQVLSINFKLTDAVGNSTDKPVSAKIDKKAPEASVRLKADGQSYNSNSWTNKDVVVEFYDFDDQAAVVSAVGVNSSEFTTTNTTAGKVISYTISTAANTEQIPSITFTLKDALGNETEKTVSAKIDKIAPTATVVITDNSDRTKTATATASESGVTFTNPGGNTHVFDRTGSFTFEMVDKAGNTGTKEAEVNVGTTTGPDAFRNR